MKLARVFCFLVILGSSAVAVHAQTPIDPSSIIDPGPRTATPDPCSDSSYCDNFTYNASLTNSSTSKCDILGCTFFFAVPSPILIVPGTKYGCEVSGSAQLAGAPAWDLLGYLPISCTVKITDPHGNDYFDGVYLIVPGAFPGETFSVSEFGSPLAYDFPSSWTGPGGCNPCEDIKIDPTPEPRTAVLYMTGLIFLVSIARKRLGIKFRA